MDSVVEEVKPAENGVKETPPDSLSINDLLLIIGQKEAEIHLLRSQVAALSKE